MNFRSYVGRGLVTLALAGSLFLGCCDSYHPPTPNPKTEVIDAFPAQRVESMRRELSGKRLSLALITNYDPNNATERMEEMFRKDFSDLPNYVLYTSRARNLEEIFNNLRDYSVLRPIDALILAYHGNRNGMKVNSGQSINSSNVETLFRGYSFVFSEDAVILLYSCSTGKGDENIATTLADVLDRDVVAPNLRKEC